MTMKVMKTIFIIAIFMALTITLTMKNIEDEEDKPPFKLIDAPDKGLTLHDHQNKLIMPSKSVSRFLAKTKNPRAAHHCNRMCVRNSTCCNNKCIDLRTDHMNCGACKTKCKYTEACCRGECVDLACDKRHCGECNNPCLTGEYCVYGMCDYA